MQRSGRQPLFTADNVGNFHQMVIHNICQVIGRQFVRRFVKHLIVKDRRVYHDLATYQVVHMHIFVRLYLETDHILPAFGNQRVHFLFGHRQRITHLHARRSVILEIGNLRTLGFQLLRSIESDICLAGIQQHLYILLVYVAAFRLTVRTMFSTKADTLVKRNAQPLERLQYIFFRPRHKPVGIGILNAENQISSMLTGKEIIIQRSAHTTDVQRPRRTRGKTDSDFSFCHNLSYL